MKLITRRQWKECLPCYKSLKEGRRFIWNRGLGWGEVKIRKEGK